jgi:hypothetical protein
MTQMKRDVASRRLMCQTQRAKKKKKKKKAWQEF